MADYAEPHRKLARDLHSAAGRVGRDMANVIRKGAADIQRDAKILAPVDTGNLRNSISTTITGDGRTNRMSAEIGPTANYGIYLEFGTSKMRAQPYLFPATDRHEPAILAAMEQVANPKL